MNYFWLLYFFPAEAALTFGAVAALSADLLFKRGRTLRWRANAAAGIGLAAVAAAGALRALAEKRPPGLMTNEASLQLSGVDGLMFVSDDFSLRGTFVILVLSGLALLITGGAARLKNPAEHVALLLFATAGFTLMVAANHLLVIFLSLELSSLSLYILTAFDKTRPESAEAGLKYFLYGGVAAAFLLFGFSLLFGVTGELTLPAIAEAFSSLSFSRGAVLLLLVAMVMIFTGFAYKVAAAPFHLWAPDAYEGAPPASAALVASASKVAGFVLLTRFLAWMPEWIPMSLKGVSGARAALFSCWFWVMAAFIAASLLLGNLAALAQTNARRLLAYSAVAHAGVLLLAVVSSGTAGLGVESVYAASRFGKLEGGGVVLFYLFAYGLATVGAFGVVAVLENNGGCRKISDFAGLWKRSPLLTACLSVFVLSLAGVPPLAGFLSKFAVFLQAAKAALQRPSFSPLLWLVLLAVAMSAVALYYYLQILKAAFVAPPPEGEGAGAEKIHTPFSAAAALVASALALIALGAAPGIFLS
jgi:NADH-quinone oxidoreductase subunit N